MTEQDCARSEGLLAQMLALHPTEIDLSLDRMHRLLQAMGAPHERLKNVLHIAGTNGKGSTQAYLKAGLRAAGRFAAAYTSPHLVRVIFMWYCPPPIAECTAWPERRRRPHAILWRQIA